MASNLITDFALAAHGGPAGLTGAFESEDIPEEWLEERQLFSDHNEIFRQGGIWRTRKPFRN